MGKLPQHHLSLARHVRCDHRERALPDFLPRQVLCHRYCELVEDPRGGGDGARRVRREAAQHEGGERSG